MCLAYIVGKGRIDLGESRELCHIIFLRILMRKNYFDYSWKTEVNRCARRALFHLWIILGEHLNWRSWSQTGIYHKRQEVGQLSLRRWAGPWQERLGKRWGGQLRQNPTAKARRSSSQFGWSRRNVEVLYNPQMVWTLSITRKVLGGKV